MIFLSKQKPEAPSSGSSPPRFLEKQNKEGISLPCNRPYSNSTALPVTLLHRVFGEFVDDCKHLVPTPADVKLLCDIVEPMVNIYKLEDDRRDKLLEIFQDNEIDVKPSVIGRYATDDNLSYFSFQLLITEFKNEIGSEVAEPYFQALIYYLETMRDVVPKRSHSVLPCIIVLIFGELAVFILASSYF